MPLAAPLALAWADEFDELLGSVGSLEDESDETLAAVALDRVLRRGPHACAELEALRALVASAPPNLPQSRLSIWLRERTLS